MEFLTPEDASAVLSFGSISFSGSILKIRRPKDFVDMVVKIIIIIIFSLAYGFIMIFMLPFSFNICWFTLDVCDTSLLIV